MKLSVLSTSIEETNRLGERIADALLPSLVIGLDGTLGSGKTHLVQAIAVGLGIERAQVNSPTFTICVPHDGRLKILHLDAYRIEHQEELDELGLDEEVEDGAVLLVEWAKRVEQSLPPIDVQIITTPIEKSQRKYELHGHSELGISVVKSIAENHDG